MINGVSGYTHSQEELDYYANQNNPNNDAYSDDLDNQADQLNPIMMNIRKTNTSTNGNAA